MSEIKSGWPYDYNNKPFLVDYGTGKPPTEEDMIDLMTKHRNPYPTDAQERKEIPVATGVLDYFPLALLEIAKLSRIGNEQHNPGEPLHWAKEKSTDESDSLIRHFLERDKVDTDGVLHATKVAWRALAYLQRKLEE